MISKTKALVLLVLVLLLVWYYTKESIEQYGSGSLIQLYSKGLQDTHLSKDAWNYWPFWNYNYYSPRRHWANRNRYYHNLPYLYRYY